MAITDGLISYYKLDGDATDVLGTNNGTATNVSWTAGKINNAGSFTTTTSKILLSNETAFDFDRTTAFSVSMWVKLNSLTTTSFLFSKQLNSGNYTGYSIYQTSSGKLEFGIAATASNNAIINTPTLPNTTNFHCITATYDGSSSANGLAVYINGIKQTNTVMSNNLTSSILNNQQFEIGNRSGAFNFGGLIDEVGIWNRALTQDEITQLYNGGSGIAYPFNIYGIVNEPTRTRYRNELGQIDAVGQYVTFPASGLVSYYKLDETTGTSVADSFGSNTGTASNVSWTAGKINNAGSFNGSSSQVVKTGLSFSPTELTISARIKKKRNTKDERYICLFNPSGAGTELSIMSANTTEGNIGIVAYVGGWKFFGNCNSGILNNNWMHVVYVAGTNYNKLYINGVEKTLTYSNGNASTGLGTPTITQWGMGSNSNSAQYAQADVDEVGIRNRALTQDEITVLYNLGNGRTLA